MKFNLSCKFKANWNLTDYLRIKVFENIVTFPLVGNAETIAIMISVELIVSGNHNIF